MRILKCRIFLSILGSIFIVLYRNSENKGFRRWWTSFKMAVLIAGILASLIPNSTEAIEPYGTNPNPIRYRTTGRLQEPLQRQNRSDRSKSKMFPLFPLSDVTIKVETEEVQFETPENLTD